MASLYGHAVFLILKRVLPGHFAGSLREATLEHRADFARFIVLFYTYPVNKFSRVDLQMSGKWTRASRSIYVKI